jgi:ADP-ribose pyrophosphatase YjhB (NUDIX family)
MTKFPGGGLQLGEGTIECLKREYIEEMNQEINILKHFYTTEFYHETKLIAEKQQLISIYYTTELIKPINFEISINRFSFKEEINGAQIFRWEKIDENLEKQLSFPIDKIVAKKLINTYK